MVYTWRTHKTSKGYQYKVLNTTYKKTKTIKTGNLKTRARAKSQAQKWVRYYKAKEKKK